MKTNELIGPALDWAVAKCEGAHGLMSDGITCSFSLNGQLRVLSHGWAPAMSYNPSSNWALAGPIIEREGIMFGQWVSTKQWQAVNALVTHVFTAKTPLIAAMRCYVASKLGDEVEVPEELQCS